MLNICLERKSIREGRLPFAMIQQEGKTDSDDEFFDCDEDRVIDDEGAKWCMQNSSSKLIFFIFRNSTSIAMEPRGTSFKAG